MANALKGTELQKTLSIYKNTYKSSYQLNYAIKNVQFFGNFNT